MQGVLSVVEQWVEEHTPNPSQEGNYPPRQALPATPQEEVTFFVALYHLFREGK